MLYALPYSKRTFNQYLRIIGLLAMFFSASVFGNDAKVYPAFMCLESGVETGAFNRSMFGITRVDDKGSGILICPIVRDSIADSSGRLESQNVVQVEVNTFRTDPAPKIRLTLRKFTSKGAAIDEDTKLPQSGHQSSILQVEFKKDDGYYVLEVEMGVNKPKEYSKVFSYKFIE